MNERLRFEIINVTYGPIYVRRVRPYMKILVFDQIVT